MNFKEFKEKFLKLEVEEFKNSVPNNIVLSVCIQTYNHDKYIGQCLDAVLSQKTNFKFEILIGEDDSTDCTRQICIDYATRYPEKIKLFLHKRENNIKVGSTSTGIFTSLFNLYSAGGKYIAYCDGDDYWDDPQKLQKQVDFLEKNLDYSMCFHRFKTLNTAESSLVPEQITYDLSNDELIKIKYHPLIITYCFRKIEIIPIPITEIINADSFLLSILGQYGKGKYLSHIKPAVYRYHQGGIFSSKAMEQRCLFEINTYKVLSNYYKKDKGLKEYFRKRVLDYQKMLLKFYIKSGQLRKLFRIIDQMILNKRSTYLI